MRTRRHLSSSDPMPVRHRASDQSDSGHISVLLHESLELLDVQASDTVLDATLGGAGHATAIAAQLEKGGTLIGIDADPAAIERAQAALTHVAPRTVLIEGNFRNVKSYLGKHGISYIDKALFDLGWSSYQLHDGRGFSFLTDDPLRMTYGRGEGLTARTIVNEWEASSIADILFGWGEEKFSRQIARGIVEARKEKAIETARELAEIVTRSVPGFYRRGARHAATKTFQALRIAVNDEMGALTEGLSGAWQSLSSGGRIVVITFHSVEDRIVKRLMRGWVDAGEGTLLVKKPIVPSPEEIHRNTRSRSAKLRGIAKI